MKIITLNEMLRYDTEENIKNKFLNSFKSLTNNDVKKFLHNKAIEMEKSLFLQLISYLMIKNKLDIYHYQIKVWFYQKKE